MRVNKCNHDWCCSIFTTRMNKWSHSQVIYTHQHRVRKQVWTLSRVTASPRSVTCSFRLAWSRAPGPCWYGWSRPLNGREVMDRAAGRYPGEFMTGFTCCEHATRAHRTHANMWWRRGCGEMHRIQTSSRPWSASKTKKFSKFFIKSF